MNQQDIDEYSDLIKKITGTLENQQIDNIVPILSILLAEAMVMSGTEKKKCVSYVVGVIDRAFNNSQKGELQ